MELELKHLSVYLPYDVNVKIVKQIRNYKINQIRKLNIQLFWDFSRKKENIIIPVLRPIKDVETFKYKPRYGKEITVSQILTIENMENLLLNNIDEIPYAIINILFKYHFDVFGLISKNLAVDINCL